MEYIIIGLCILVVVLFALLLITRSEIDKVQQSKIRETIKLRGRAESLTMELKAVQTRQVNLEKSLLSWQQKFKELGDKYNGKPAVTGWNSAILSKQLRFIFPNDEIANNVKVKVNRVDDEITGIKATVRKKVDGKFTDVEVRPVMVD